MDVSVTLKDVLSFIPYRNLILFSEVVAYVCVRVGNTWELYVVALHISYAVWSITLFASTILLLTRSLTLEYQFCFSSR